MGTVGDRSETSRQCIAIDKDMKDILTKLLIAYNGKRQEVLSASITPDARLTRCDRSGSCRTYSTKDYPNMDDWRKWGNKFGVKIESLCTKAFSKFSEDGVDKTSVVADFDFSYEEEGQSYSPHIQASMIFRKQNGNWLLSDWTNAIK
jgi:hypothetical protein